MSSFSKRLEQESKNWVGDNTITAAQRKALLDKYPQEKGQLTSQIVPILSGLMIGLGLVALSAYNWNIFPRWAKLTLGFLPWGLGAAALIWGRIRQQRSWGEAGALFNIFAVMVALGIVSQVYQLQGDTKDYLLWVLLISLPVVLAERSMAGGLGWILVLTVLCQWWEGERQPLYLVLFLAVPLLGLLRHKQERTSRIIYLLGAGGFTLGVLHLIPSVNQVGGIIILLALGALWSSLGDWLEGESSWRLVSILGAALVLGVFFIAGFSGFWQGLNLEGISVLDQLGRNTSLWLGLTIGAGLGSIVAWTGRLILYKTWNPFPVGALILVLILVGVDLSGLSLRPMEWVLLVDLLVLAQALFWIFDPEKRDLRILGGTALVLALVNQRFFDGDFSFLVKGLVLIVSGLVLALIHRLKGGWKTGGVTR